MSKNSIRVWELTLAHGATELHLPDMSSLDALTRNLPQGYYSTFRTYDHGRCVLGLRAHLRRLYQPASAQNIAPSIPVHELRQKLAELLQAYADEARVRAILTSAGQVYLALEALKTLPAEVYLHGVEVVTVEVERRDPRLKSTAFISASEEARAEIARKHIFEALLARNGSILEGMTSNFFYCKDGDLGTARNDILLGITRQTVLRVARGSGLRLRYRPLKQEQVPALSEAFLTSSSRGIVPIIKIDDEVVGEGVPGPTTQKLMDGYRAYVLKHAERIYPKR